MVIVSDYNIATYGTVDQTCIETYNSIHGLVLDPEFLALSIGTMTDNANDGIFVSSCICISA